MREELQVQNNGNLKEANTKQIYLKAFSLIISVFVLMLIMILKSFGVLKIEISPITILIIQITIIASLVATVLVIILKYLNINKKEKYYYLQILDFFLIVNTALVVIQLIFVFILYPAEVNQTSMAPTLQDKDNIIVISLDKVDNGDIVVLKYNTKINENVMLINNGDLLIKRVVASGGDTYYFDSEGYLFVNGEKIHEDYLSNGPSINKSIGATKFGSECSPSSICTVPVDYYFALGDNRSNSIDSPELGYFHKSQVYGVAKYRMKSIYNWERLK